jgi:hypothetical protein
MTTRTMTMARPAAVPTLALTSAAAAALGIVNVVLGMTISALAYDAPPVPIT